MANAVRSYLTVGVAAVAASAIVISPTTPSVPRTVAEPAPSVQLAASVKPLLLEPPTVQDVVTARDLISRIDPTQVRALPALAADGPTTLNAASDFVTSTYEFIQYWVDYGVQLANYALGFIPYGGSIANQVNIFYYQLIRPIANSVVYQLINPVLNDPLNPAVYVDGFVDVGQASINAAINTGIAEFNTFFGWLIPPLPPLPPLPFQVPETATTLTDATVQDETVQDGTPGLDTDTAVTAELPTKSLLQTGLDRIFHPRFTAAEKQTETPAAVETEGEDAEIVKDVKPALPETPTLPRKVVKTPFKKFDLGKTIRSVLGGVQAQGEVRGGTTTTGTTGTTGTTPTGSAGTGTTGTNTTDTRSGPVGGAPETDNTDTPKNADPQG